MDKKRRLKKFLILLILAFICGACSSNKQKNHETQEDQLIYGNTKDIRDINPHLYSGEMAAQNMVFEGLTKNEHGKVKPALAESWSISPDGLCYTFRLRKNVKFSNGENFDADTVKMNIDAILSNKNRHAWLELVNQIKNTKVIDKFTFQLNLKKPYYPTLTELALTRPFRFIAPSCFINGETKNGVKNYIGTGPWILKEHKNNQEAIFIKNDNYWGKMPKMNQVIWKVISDSQTLELALKNREIDLIYGSDGDQISTTNFTELENDKNFSTYISNPIASRAVLLNSNRPFLKDLKVRKAVEYAVDKTSIVKGVLNNIEIEAPTLLSSNVPYCDVNLKTYNYDPNKAKSLLEQAGWYLGNDNIREKNGKQLKLVFSYNSQNEQEGEIAQVIQSNLKQIGILVDILPEEKQMFLDRQKNGNFDLQYSLSWGTPYDPQSYVSSWRIPAHGDYQAQQGLSRKKWLDEKISQTLVESDDITRKNNYKEILTYISDQCIYLPISYSRTKAIATSQLKGVTFNDSQYEIPFEKMYKLQN